MTTQEITPTTIQSEEKITKVVLRGYCKRLNHSLNLDSETLYYLEPHGKGHYFVSKFPSASRSQMGIYEASRFNIVREEVVEVNKPKAAVSHKLQVQNEPEAAPEQNHKVSKSEHISFENIEEQLKEEMVPAALNTEEKKNLIENKPNELPIIQEDEQPTTELINAKDLLFAEHFNVQDPSEMPPLEKMPNLEQGKVYKSQIVYRGAAYSHMELGSIFYITLKSIDHPNYNDKSCLVYKDAACEQFYGSFPIVWFSLIEEVSTVEDFEEPHMEDEFTSNTSDEPIHNEEHTEPILIIGGPEQIDELNREVVEVETKTVSPVINLFDTSIVELKSTPKRKKNKVVDEDPEQISLFDF